MKYADFSDKIVGLFNWAAQNQSPFLVPSPTTTELDELCRNENSYWVIRYSPNIMPIEPFADYLHSIDAEPDA